MKKHDGWLTSLFALIFIATPSIVGIFLLVDSETIDYGLIWGIGTAILIGSNLITYLAYKFKLLAIDAFTFIFPLSVVFFLIYGTMYEAWWLMLIVAVIGVLTSFPANIVVTRIKEDKLAKIKEASKEAQKTGRA